MMPFSLKPTIFLFWVWLKMAKQKRIASVLLSTLFILFLHIDCVVAMPDAKHTICCYLNFFFCLFFTRKCFLWLFGLNIIVRSSATAREIFFIISNSDLDFFWTLFGFCAGVSVMILNEWSAHKYIRRIFSFRRKAHQQQMILSDRP